MHSPSMLDCLQGSHAHENESSRNGEGISLPGGTSEMKKDGTGIVDSHRENGLLILPKKGFVIKTRQELQSKHAPEDTAGKKLFINVCSSDEISKPGKQKRLDADGNEIEGLNMPVSIGPIRSCVDNDGRPSRAVDCVVHASVLADVESDTTGSYRNFICQFLISSVEEKHAAECKPIDRRYKLPRSKYHGFVDSRTGIAVMDKRSEYAEVARQYVRDAKRRPRIEEVEGVESAKRGVSPDPRSSCATPSDAAAPLVPVPAQIFVEDAGGERVELFDFVEISNGQPTSSPSEGGASGEIERGSPSEAFRVRPALSRDDERPRDLDPSQLLARPLLWDPAAAAPTTENGADGRRTRRFEKLCVVFDASRIDPPSSVEVELSAFRAFVSGGGIGRTECILPLCVAPTTAKCVYDGGTSTLTLTVSLSDARMDEAPDVGTRQWTLAEALRDGETTPPGQKRRCDPGRAEAEGSRIRDDEPSSHSERDESAFDGTEPLPEDRFHAKDVMSQHMMELQEQRRREKSDKKPERSESTAGVDEGGDIEYLDADDFRPGGKYYEEGVAGAAAPAVEKGATELEKAEDIVRAGGPDALSNGLWADLF